MQRRHRRLTSWTALLAFLWATLAPTAALAWPQPADGTLWLDLCSAAGGQHIGVPLHDEDDGAIIDEHPMPGGHCLLCAHPATPGDTPQRAVHVVAAQAATLPRLFYRAPRPLFVWSAAQPRAPPIPA